MAVEEEELHYPALVNRWQRERATASPTKIDGNFYEHFDARLRELVAEYQREHAINPTTPKVLILQDELSNLQRIRDDIYDLREKKIATSAIIAARGGHPDRANMTKEEEALFETLLRTLRDARRNLLLRGTPAKELPKPHAAGPPAPPEDAGRHIASAAQPAAVLAERTHGAENAPEAPLPLAPAPTPPRHHPAAENIQPSEEEEKPKRLGPARTLVRITGAVAPFVASDMRAYTLHIEDVVALPKEFAHALAQRGLAKVIAT